MRVVTLKERGDSQLGHFWESHGLEQSSLNGRQVFWNSAKFHCGLWIIVDRTLFKKCSIGLVNVVQLPPVENITTVVLYYKRFSVDHGRRCKWKNWHVIIWRNVGVFGPFAWIRDFSGCKNKQTRCENKFLIHSQFIFYWIPSPFYPRLWMQIQNETKTPWQKHIRYIKWIAN